MTLKHDGWIRQQGMYRGMIAPFEPETVNTVNGERVLSYGTSSYGYDIRASQDFLIFTNVNSAVVDPKNFDERSFVKVTAKEILIPPNSFILARSLEYVKVPRDILVVCVGKSTLARAGINTLVTPLEPEWEGHITLEFANTTPLPVKFYAEEGCAQLLFYESEVECTYSYKDRSGKYQGQTGITLPKV